ncbi:MAG: hypothetical protein KF911_13080 [Pseudomonadales bacterium]|nr:hypothetical protein [Pseudomonadales bacterium]
MAVTLYRTLYWGRNHVPPGIRSLIGVLFMIAGIFGFLPILGFWMLPVGVAFVALDVPRARHRIDAWMLRLAREGKLDRRHHDQPLEDPADDRQRDDPPTSSQ